MKRLTVPLCALLLALATSPGFAAGASPWEAMSFSAGVQGRWLDGGVSSGNRDLEFAGNAALGLTNNIDVTGGVAYGVQGSYVRAQTDVRLTATDANDPNFNIWIGVGRYFSKRPEDGLNETAGKAGFGWRPFPDHPDGRKGFPVILGATAAVTIAEPRRPQIVVSAVVPLRMTKGGE